MEYLVVVLLVIPCTTAINLPLDDLIDSFNYSYSNGSIDITTFQDYMKDTNSNGANDTLIINLTAGTLTDGTYTFIVSLLDNGKIRLNSSTKAMSGSGASAQVNFPTDLLEAKMFNYTLEILNINDELVFRTNKIQTNSYLSYEGGLSLINFSDQNIGNNYMEITLNLNSSRTFTANITVTLAYNSSTISATEEKSLSAGINSYTIKVDNETIKSTHYSSNFTFDAIIIGNKAFDTNKNTSVHNYESFAKTSYIKSARDGKIDANGNNLSELLEINFSVISVDTGTYTLSYDLYDEFDNFVTNISKTQVLSVGNNTIQTRINGSDIYKTKINGPYLISFASLATGGETKDILFNALTTQEIFYTDFERPPLPDLEVNLTFEFNQTTNITNLTIILKNQGTAPAFNVFLDLFDNTTYQNNRSLSFMDVGESITYKFNMTNSSNTTLYTAIVDFDNLVDEINESNNIAQNVEAEATVVSLAIDSITELYANNTEKIFEFVIHNDGTTTVNSISWQFDTGDGTVINSTQNISSLSSGGKVFVYIAYNYSSQGSFTIKANATGLTDVIASLSTSVQIGNLIITSFDDLSIEGTKVIFETKAKNLEESNLSINWSLTPGDGNSIFSQSQLTLIANETVFIYTGHDYGKGGTFSATSYIASGALSDNEMIIVEIPSLAVQSLLLLNKSGTATIVEGTIKNGLSLNLTNVSWSYDTKNNNILNSTSGVILTSNESIFTYIGYNFTSSGIFNVNATARNGTLMDSYNLSIII